jgi:hypothetical protein
MQNLGIIAQPDPLQYRKCKDGGLRSKDNSPPFVESREVYSNQSCFGSHASTIRMAIVTVTAAIPIPKICDSVVVSQIERIRHIACTMRPIPAAVNSAFTHKSQSLGISLLRLSRSSIGLPTNSDIEGGVSSHIRVTRNWETAMLPTQLGKQICRATCKGEPMVRCK